MSAADGPNSPASDSSPLERKLHECQVLLWLRQKYSHEFEGSSTDQRRCRFHGYNTELEQSMAKEAVYQDYLNMCREADLVPTFSRPMLGKMVKRAFQGIETRRRGPRNGAKQHWVGLRLSSDGDGVHVQDGRLYLPKDAVSLIQSSASHPDPPATSTNPSAKSSPSACSLPTDYSTTMTGDSFGSGSSSSHRVPALERRSTTVLSSESSLCDAWAASNVHSRPPMQPSSRENVDRPRPPSYSPLASRPEFPPPEPSTRYSSSPSSSRPPPHAPSPQESRARGTEPCAAPPPYLNAT